ncbi:hypothetical protein O0L34_g13746 [Tuta absoluta]|nr:hypothetical protein O0L34_g13746 [Tuta absoluta]
MLLLSLLDYITTGLFIKRCSRKLCYFVSVTLASSEARNSHFYRRDYTYFVEYDAFYKLHWQKNGVSWNNAFTTCNDEGAKLFYPEEEGEWEVLKNLTSGLGEELETRHVIVGVHDETGRGEFVTVDGTVTPTPVIRDRVPIGHRCIAMDMNEITYKSSTCGTDPTKIFFVCKRVDENKRPCPTIDMSYDYKAETKKCYKIHNRTKSWPEAWHTCYMEGGMLLTIDSESEARIVENMIKNKNMNHFVGFRQIFPGSDFYTVRGKRVQESGFERWNESDNQNRENSHDSPTICDDNNDNLTICGAIYLKDYWGTQLYMTSEDCLNHRPFVCEMAARAFNINY